jgi:transcriptional regulator with GAF, ATPase, and Fis domain
MKRRGASGKLVKGRRTLRPKPRKLTTRVSPADLQEQVAALTRELKEAREQQTASGEILASIAGSVTDPKPVFDAIARNLRRLSGVRFAVVQVLKDGMVHLVAAGHEEEFKLLSKYFPQPVDENTGGGRAMLSKHVCQYVPVLGNPDAPSATQLFAREIGFNSVIFAPMIRDGKVIGSLSAARREPKAFDDEQVDLIKAFADQAVIAIENVRLFEAEQQRTRELSESLEQQTATSEVLKVISALPGELQQVFDAMLANATRLCGASYGAL